jgi:hypothetical protein
MEGNRLGHTIGSCIGFGDDWTDYATGKLDNHYPVPAIIYHVYLPCEFKDGDTECGSIWEYSRFSCEPYETTYNKRVRVLRA